MKYTEKIHARRLLGMLNKKNPCMWCPQERHYGASEEGGDMPWQKDGETCDDACRVCMDFVNVAKEDHKWCPCLILGEKQAIKRTWIALETKGYI